MTEPEINKTQPPLANTPDQPASLLAQAAILAAKAGDLGKTPAPAPGNETPTDGKASEGKSASEAKPKPEPGAPVVPQKYELKLPEKDAFLSLKQVEGIAAYARERGLSQEDAQKLLERENGLIAEHVRQADSENAKGGRAYMERLDAFKTAALADTEIGGTEENLMKSSQIAYRVISQHFPPEMLEFLEESGLGSHPAVIKGFARLGRPSQPEKLLSGGGPVTPPQTPEVIQQTRQKKFYDHPTSVG